MTKLKLTPVSKGHAPKGARGRAQVKKLGRTKTTGNFNKIAQKAAKEYGSAAAGKRVAGAIFNSKVRAHVRRLLKK